MTTKDQNPRFTVIIPTKDRADYLYHTLKTCAFQDYDNLEILVSDDGSFDHTREIIEEASSKDPRIKYITPDNRGMIGVVNGRPVSGACDDYACAVQSSRCLVPPSAHPMDRCHMPDRQSIVWVSQ